MREWFIAEALTSVRRLTNVIRQMTDEEIKHVIELEEAGLKRSILLDKLYREMRQRARKEFIR